MALLKRCTLASAYALALAGCADAESLGHADVWLHGCDAAESCRSPGEHFSVQAYFAAGASKYAPDGFQAVA
jgi:hypothetical protein